MGSEGQVVGGVSGQDGENTGEASTTVEVKTGVERDPGPALFTLLSAPPF